MINALSGIMNKNIQTEKAVAIYVNRFLLPERGATNFVEHARAIFSAMGAAKERSESATSRSERVTRDNTFVLLGDDELVCLSCAETTTRLAEGEEYLDLKALTKGVRRASGGGVQCGRVIPRRAVQTATWDKILAELPRTKPVERCAFLCLATGQETP